jgi:hypothetical protein
VCRVIRVTDWLPASTWSASVTRVVCAPPPPRLEEAGQGRLGLKTLAQLVLLGGRLELADVLDPALALDRGVGLQLPHQAGQGPGVLDEHARGTALRDPGGQLVQHGHEVGHGPDLAGAKARHLPGPPQRLPERDLLLGGEPVDGPLGGVADATPGHVQDPPQADRVQRVDRGFQVRQQVLDLPPVVELDPADDLVGQAGLDEHLLQGP